MDRHVPAEPLSLEFVDGVPVTRLLQRHAVFEDAVDLVTGVLRRARAEGFPHLVIDVRDAAFPPPTLAQRLDMVRQWAEAADGRLRVAMVAPPHFVDAERFGVVAAGNFGLAGQVFLETRDALAWLHDERAAELRRGT